MGTISSKRSDAFAHAKNYGAAKHFSMMVAWLERAVQNYGPLNEIQMWRLKCVIGPYKYDELNLDRFLKRRTEINEKNFRKA